MMAMPAETCAWRLADLAQGLVAEAAVAGALGDRRISSLTLDSRSAVPGSLFLACQGERVHGLAFAEEAARRGAVAILAEPSVAWPSEALAQVQARTGVPIVAAPGLAAGLGRLADRFYGEPSAAMEVFGVAGAHGKTSVAHLLAQTLGQRLRCGVLGAAGVGYPGELNAATSPATDALGLQSTLATLRRHGASAIAMAIPTGTVARGLTDGVRFSHAILTRGDADPGALARLVQTPGLRWTVLDLDDPGHTRLLATLPPEMRVAGYSLRPDAPIPARCDLWVRAASLRPLAAGLRIRAASNTGHGVLQAPLMGLFNGANLLAVLAVLLSRGATMDEALRHLRQVRGVPGRMEAFGGDGAPLAVVDCARTPDALEKALTSLRLHGCRRSIAVVGCVGERDRGQRPRIGAIAERLSDALILTDDNPGREDGDAIAADILAGVSHPERVRVERRRGLAIRRAIAIAGRGDAVLVAGQGHETTQNQGGLQVHFSDRAQVVEALREWREGHH